MIKDSKILGPSQIPSDKELQEIMDEIFMKIETKPQLKFKAGDRVFNKVTRKWVNIIEFDIETGLYIVRYDDGIQGRSLESELCEGIVEETTIKIKDLRKFINQMEIEGLNDETVLTFETKRSSEHIENITSMEYSPTTNILIFS